MNNQTLVFNDAKSLGEFIATVVPSGLAFNVIQNCDGFLVKITGY